MMELPIPQDWDGETWRCVQIEWPDSITWIAYLLGNLSMFMRGRLWNGSTGSIIGVQEIGREIWLRNNLLTPCETLECPECPETPRNGSNVPPFDFTALMCQSEECSLMSCGPCLPIKIENGILYWWNCGEWAEVGAMQVVGQPISGITTEEPPSAYSACGKIDAMAAAIATIAQAVWDNKDGLTYFLNIGAVDSALPGFDVNNVGILSLLSGARVLDDVYSEEELLDPDYLQSWRCVGQSQLSTTSATLTQFEYDALYALLASVVPADTIGWYQGIMSAIGFNSLNLIAASGSANTGADCDCPVTLSYPGFTVYQLQWDFTYFSPNTTEQHDVNLTGGDFPPGPWKAAIFEWEGLNDPNGEIKVYDQAFQVISNYSTGSGIFALYDNADSVGQNFLNLYYPSVSKAAASDPTEYQDGILTVQTSGNNVQVTTTGTLTIIVEE